MSEQSPETSIVYFIPDPEEAQPRINRNLSLVNNSSASLNHSSSARLLFKGGLFKLYEVIELISNTAANANNNNNSLLYLQPKGFKLINHAIYLFAGFNDAFDDNAVEFLPENSDSGGGAIFWTNGLIKELNMNTNQNTINTLPNGHNRTSSAGEFSVNKKIYSTTNRILFQEIKEIYRGKQSAVFKQITNEVVADYLCFTIKTKSRELNLSAESEAQRDEFITAIIKLIQAKCNKLVLSNPDILTQTHYLLKNHGSTSNLHAQSADEGNAEKLILNDNQEIKVDIKVKPIVVGEENATKNSIPASNLIEKLGNGDYSKADDKPPLSPRSLSHQASILETEATKAGNIKVSLQKRLAKQKAAMQLDMRYTLLDCTREATKQLKLYDSDPLKASEEEFAHVLKKNTTHLTPNFEYKGYCGSIFARLRRHFGLKDSDFLNSVASPKGYLDFVSNSKSGSFFFYSYDNLFMLKSLTKAESKLFRGKLLRSYYHHLINNHDSLIIKMFGMYRLVKHSKQIYFVVMKNVFWSNLPIHIRFDLKGSSVGRFAKTKEKEQATPVLKDLDFDGGTNIHGQELKPITLKLGSRKQAFIDQLTSDAKFLETLNVMDYSLLVGIHYRDRYTKLQNVVKHQMHQSDQNTINIHSNNGSFEQNVSTTANPSSFEHPELPNSPKSEAAVQFGSGAVRQTNYGTKKKEFVIPAQLIRSYTKAQMIKKGYDETTFESELDDFTEEQDEKLQSLSSFYENGAESKETNGTTYNSTSNLNRKSLLFARRSSLFTEDDGGLASPNVKLLHSADSNAANHAMNHMHSEWIEELEGNEVYYFGIIDFSTEYTLMKRAEHALKSITNNSKEISCVHPALYAKRFIEFITKHVQGEEDNVIIQTGSTPG
jgi:hypothetical protein